MIHIVPWYLTRFLVRKLILNLLTEFEQSKDAMYEHLMLHIGQDYIHIHGTTQVEACGYG